MSSLALSTLPSAIAFKASLQLTRASPALIKKAEGQIAEAHHVQTDAIQGSIGGETQAYSLLFAHAQDTLMTVYSEIHMTKQLLLIFEGYEQRIRTLEEKIAK